MNPRVAEVGVAVGDTPGVGGDSSEVGSGVSVGALTEESGVEVSGVGLC